MDEEKTPLGPRIVPGSPVVAYLQNPREKMWGVLWELNGSGLHLLGIDVNTFEDWVQMLMSGERNIGLSNVFLPMWRVERIVKDETLDDIQSLADRFHYRVGMTLEEYLGI